MGNKLNLTIEIKPLTPEEEAMHVAAKMDASEYNAVQVTVPAMQIVGEHADGAKVWQATFVTPPGFFDFERSRLIGANGQPANIQAEIGKTFSRLLMPSLRLVVRTAKMGKAARDALVEARAKREAASDA